MPPRTQKSKPVVVDAVPQTRVVEPEVVTPLVAVTPVSVAPARKRKQQKEDVVVPEPVVEAAPVVVEAAPVDQQVEAVRERAVPTVETVHTEFAELVTLIDEQAAAATDKVVTKTLRTILKRVKALQGTTSRVLKRKQTTKRAINPMSGFLKPVGISDEISKFTGLDASTLHSRVDVTTFLCDYIKKHNLQNPNDRRQIVADAALSKLLNYDGKKADKPLTYAHMQFLLKNHFTKEDSD